MRRTRIALAALAVAATGTVVTSVVAATQASSGTPQIPGSVAAPTASEVSPICAAPNPVNNLGPQPSLPPSPISTVASPSGGVVSFTATSSDLYVNTGTNLATYTLGGTLVNSFALPAAFAGSNAQDSQIVVDPSGTSIWHRFSISWWTNSLRPESLDGQ